MLIIAALMCSGPTVTAQPVSEFGDPPHIPLIRRTDTGAQGVIDPQTQNLPVIVEMRIGNFAPTEPHENRFAGSWQIDGGFLRFDMVFAGLINPPGPLAWDDVNPVYDPMHYGPNPLFGYIEFDVDANENTGGEPYAPQYRYLGNVARFGGLPSDPRFAGRVALDNRAFDGDITTPPFVDRSGEEFHLAFQGELIEAVTVIHEKLGGNPAVFEEGEIWRITGKLFHRAHGFEPFAFACVADPGFYEPEVVIQFEHSIAADTTTVSLVYPLSNSACAALENDDQGTEPDDGCAGNQNSIDEALDDLRFSATYTDPITRQLPTFALMAGWQFEDPSDYLHPAAWRVFGIVGTAYAVQQPDGARFAWTDVYPRPLLGDFDGSGAADAADTALLAGFVAPRDGDPAYDDDGIVNGIVQVRGFADNFSLYDIDYDGLVTPCLTVLPGDMNLDGVVDLNDVSGFIQALLDPTAYTLSHDGIDPVTRGDINLDGFLNGRDITEFVALLVGA